jgi:HPt (histidine-containing phosphotransfer) domain-containing protein
MPEVLDQRALDDLLAMVGNDPEFVDELVDAYLADAPLQEAAIRSALGSGDTEALVRAAHTLKSTSMSLGGRQVAEIARAIEERGRTGSVDDVGTSLSDLEAAGTELAAALQAARARRWTSG